MDGKKGLYWHPNSDSNFSRQAASLRAADFAAKSLAEQENHGNSNYRLHGRVAWLKLVHPEGRRSFASDESLVQGMYLPFDYFDSLQRSGELIGPRNGLRVDYATVPRHVSPTLFTELLKGGWIGSVVATEDLLKVLVASFESSGSLSLATTPGPKSTGTGYLDTDNSQRELFGATAKSLPSDPRKSGQLQATKQRLDSDRSSEQLDLLDLL